MKDAINSPEPMSIDEAYANAVITEALDTEDEMTGNTIWIYHVYFIKRCNFNKGRYWLRDILRAK